MTTSNAVVDSGKGGAEKHPDKQIEKLAEKRRALGRGLESLLPGPAEGRSQGSGVRSQEKPSSAEFADGRAPVAASAALPLAARGPADPVSYTHLDVYKRQNQAIRQSSQNDVWPH